LLISGIFDRCFHFRAGLHRDLRDQGCQQHHGAAENRDTVPDHLGGFILYRPEKLASFCAKRCGWGIEGRSGVFFAYIGFDAISTTAEECRNPRRDLPRAIILALIITTILYIMISLVLTGMVHYSELGVGDPLAFAFEKLHLTKLSGIIAISAVIAMASVLLVFQVGQPASG